MTTTDQPAKIIPGTTMFQNSERSDELLSVLREFMTTDVYPAEALMRQQRSESGDVWYHAPVMEDLKQKARSLGLWNLFLPDSDLGAGLSNLEYAPLAEESGRSFWMAPEAMNCAAPDTGNMEILAMFGSPAMKDAWLTPLLDGTVRSCFSMTEPAEASSDANNIATSITRDGDDYVINGVKWWSSGAMRERCKVAIVMGISDADGPRHRRHSMIVVPLDTPGVRVVRSTKVLGFEDGSHGGHAEIEYNNVRVPADHMLGDAGDGFKIAQARLGPGRVHHAMRTIGMAERAFDLMCERVHQRSPFGKPLSEQGVIQDWIATARIWIEQVRLLVLKTAWLIDTVGARGASVEVSAIKVAAPEMATWVIDKAIQAHGGLGLSQDSPLAEMYAHARVLRIADGPDEVHKMALARRELRRYGS